MTTKAIKKLIETLNARGVEYDNQRTLALSRQDFEAASHFGGALDELSFVIGELESLADREVQ